MKRRLVPRSDAPSALRFRGGRGEGSRSQTTVTYWNEIATLWSRSKYSATDDEVIKFYTTTWLGFGQDPSELYESLLVLNTVLEDVFCHTTVSRGERLLWKKFLS